MSEQVNSQIQDASESFEAEFKIPEIKHPLREAARMFARNKAAVGGLFLLLGILILTLVAPFFYTVDPFDLVWAPLSPPGTENAPFGTDYLGRDILAGIVHGGSATLAVGASAALLAVIIGLSIGSLAGYYGGWVDEVLMRITEFFQVLPTLLFAMVIVALFRPSIATVAFAIGVVSWTAVARLARSEFLRIRSLDYIKAARSISSSNRRIIWLVILPNAMPPLVVQATLAVGGAILFEAGLSFLGLSDPNVMSWGFMIGSSRDYLMDAWWTVTIPGIFIFLTVLAVSLIGDGLNDATNPKLRER
ncbi:MAG: ABC transporter permease [Alphaproteobacteria bacterium]|jgi:peptide/nickel transport system permease protein|nr:ABC transporter permease [Rhodospirillaceae bacterium]MDP6023099.1 ABC transporter permease [Alphaproteobacteria bacterium]MDP6256096.1 ABC transporter permease [Alphaproteobacteria bacterium]MDP7054650.1 ABC transporter permease [Alphaproteobacteria bacterium]MDP7228610.1 ABC transporter permease [Alphaproteobacteria bacterium]|tara:strand:+ start:4434 stop:5348 length:915 start_codon:yes stop_codon:yes gene_type:complete